MAWVKGNGSDLPYGTTAWVYWVAPNSERGYGMSVEYRREGGWGSNGAERDCFEEPRFPDDGYGKYGHIFALVGDHTPSVISYYMVLEEPSPPLT